MKPPTRQQQRGRVLRKVLPWLAAGVIFVFLVRYDVDLMRLRYLLIPDEPKGMLRQAIGSFREFGQAMAAIVAICIVATFDRRREAFIAALLLAEALAAGGYNAGKLTIGRYRPSAAIDLRSTDDGPDRLTILQGMQPGDSWVGWSPWNKDSKKQSFPSGHTGAAVVLAITLSAFYPRLRWLLWPLAIGCGLSRYLDAVHWLSDCWIGGLIGYAAARISLMICGPPRRL